MVVADEENQHSDRERLCRENHLAVLVLNLTNPKSLDTVSQCLRDDKCKGIWIQLRIMNDSKNHRSRDARRRNRHVIAASLIQRFSAARKLFLLDAQSEVTTWQTAEIHGVVDVHPEQAKVTKHQWCAYIDPMNGWTLGVHRADAEESRTDTIETKIMAQNA